MERKHEVYIYSPNLERCNLEQMIDKNLEEGELKNWFASGSCHTIKLGGKTKTIQG
jgi:hypothetical protein